MMDGLSETHQLHRDRNEDGVLVYLQEDIPAKPVETAMKNLNLKANMQKKEKIL